MYCLVVIISLAMAAPRVSRNCYTLCDLQKADPANVVPRGCNCSLSAVMEAESASTEVSLLDDTGVYFVPAETDQYTAQPFLISNPVIKFNQQINRIKKGSVVKKDSSEESSGRIETYERRKTFIRVGNNDGSRPSSYLDLEIQDVSGSETSVIQQGNFIPTFESTEQALVECLDLHILDFSRKYGSLESFNEFWKPRNLQVYKDLSNSDLNDNIKKYCSDTEFLIEQALQDIKRGVPKKKGNFKYVQDDFSKKNETQESVESFDFKTLSALTESTSVYGSQTELPSVLNNSVQLNLLEENDLENSDRKHESTLESMSPKLSQNTSSTTDNINDSKSTKISNKAKNAMSDVTIVTPKNTAKAYERDFDMDTMPSEVIVKTINEVKKSNYDLVTSKPILDETLMLPISTTTLSDVLYFGETSGITETSFDELEESPDKDIVLNLNTTSGVILKTNNEINNSNDEIVTISSLEPSFNKTTIFFAPITLLNKENPFRDISSTQRSIFEREVKSDDATGFDLGAISSEVNSKSKIETNTSIMNMANNELILDSMLSFPESTTLQNNKLSLGDLSSSSEKSVIKTQEGNDKGKMPSEVMLKSKNELNISNIDMAHSGAISHNITIFSTSTTLQNGNVTLEDTNSNSEIPMVEKEEGKDENKEIDSDTIPFEFILKSNNKTNETNAKKASNERILNKITLFPALTTSTSGELSLEDINNNSETSKAENEDKGIKLNFVTIPNTKIILNPSNVIFKPHLNVVANESSSNDLKLFTAASTSSQNDQVSLDIASDNTKLPTTESPKKYTDGGIDLDSNTMASNAILNTLKVVNTSDLKIADSGSILDDTFKFATTVQEETIFNTSSDKDSAIFYISTAPVTVVQTQRRNTLKESEVEIPKIITKECQNDEVQTFVNGSEALPNNDFEDSDAKTTSLQKTIRQVSSDDSKSTDSAAVFDNSYISGNLYFGTSQDLVPVRLLQSDSGKVNLGIDGQSLCEKFIKSNSKSILLSTLCDCVQQMTKNNSKECHNK